MEPQNALLLKAALSQASCIDPNGDILALPDFREIISGVKNETTAQEAARKMRELKPAFFKPRDFLAMSETQQAETEARLRQPQHLTVPKNDFAKLDAARLTDYEASALDRYAGGSRNSLDISALKSARARLMAEDAL